MTPRPLPPGQRSLREAYRRYLVPSLLAAVALHVLTLLFLVAPVERAAAERRIPIEVVRVDDLRIPPPPDELARPAEPVVAELPVDEDLTIGLTDLVEVLPIEGPPVGPPAEEETVGPFRSYTEPPRCHERCTPDDVLTHLPTLLRRQGVECDVTVGIRIDTRGQVVETRILKSSGNPTCDAAAAGWARETRWTTAYNRDQPVEVWIAQPVRIRTE